MASEIEITRDNFIQRLEESVPQFKIDSLWMDENLLYPVINDLSRYICREAEIASYIGEANGFDEIEKALGFLEECLSAEALDMRDLVHECLERLSSCKHSDLIKIHFGPRVLELWQKYF